MLLQPVAEVPRGEDWVYEPKLDGWRMLAYHSLAKVRLITRGQTDYTDSKRFLPVKEQIPESMNGLSAVYDGEVVGVLNGKHNLNTLWTPQAKLVYYVFDILEVEGTPLVGKSWATRREVLETTFQPQPNIELCPNTDDDELMEEYTSRLGFEGVVGKHKRGIYTQSGRTQRAVKLKYPDYGKESG
jgi:bifunctional non-homologous end joining protein LigD